MGAHEFDRDQTQDYAKVRLTPSVVLELIRNRGQGRSWEVWAIRIDGVLYREPRDLGIEATGRRPNGEPLYDGEFKRWLDGAFEGETRR